MFSGTSKKHDLPHRAFLAIFRYSINLFCPNRQFSKLTRFEQIVLAGSSQKGLISDIYKLLNQYSMDTQGKHRYMLKWEQAIGEELPIEKWQIIQS